MEPYVFKDDEVVFLETTVDREEGEEAELKLTNYAIVMTWTEKHGRFFNKTVEDMVLFYPLDTIKKFEGAPQIKRDGTEVTIQTIYANEKLDFPSKGEAKEFTEKVYELITGMKMAERGAKKVNGAINVVNTALGIDTMGTVTGVMQNGIIGTVLGGVGKKKKSKLDTAKEALETAQKVMTPSSSTTSGETTTASTAPASTSTAVSYEEQITLLKSLNELLQSGIITQEEFDAKKKEILGL